MYSENTNVTKRPPTKPSSNANSSNKNYFDKVQNKTSTYAFHQHGYDLSAYAQMVSAGIEPEKAINNLEYFYKNLFRLDGAENS